MIPKSFQEYYQGQTAEIVRHYNLAKKFFDVWAIHEMRVNIKRLRAFFYLVEWINPDFQAKKNFLKIRKIFKSAGKIRDIHMQQELTMGWIKKSKLEVSEYYNYLKQQELKQHPQFSTVCKKFKINEFDKNWIKIQDSLNILPENFIQFKTEERFYHLIDKLIEFKNKTSFTLEDYHNIRILAKETRYALEIFQTFFAETKHFEELNLKIRDLHRALGKWHDSEVGLLSLNDFIENFSEQLFFNRTSYNKFIENLEQGKKEWISTFEKRWKEFIDFLDNDSSLKLIETKFSLN